MDPQRLYMQVERSMIQLIHLLVQNWLLIRLHSLMNLLQR